MWAMHCGFLQCALHHCPIPVNDSKLNNWTWLEGLLLKEGKLAVGGTSIACIVSQYLRFLASCRNTVGPCCYFQILPCIVTSVKFVQQVL